MHRPQESLARRDGALAGVAAASAALGTGELLAGLWEQFPSPVLAVADVVIDRTPGDVVRWSIDTFGARQKGLLVAGIVAAALAAGALAGVLARRHLPAAAAVVTGFAAVGAAAGASDAGWWAVASGVLGAVAGITVLAVVHAAARPGGDTGDGAPPAVATTTTPLPRRTFVLAGVAAATWGIAAGGVGPVLRRSRTIEAARARVAERLGARPASLPPGTTTFDGAPPGVSPLLTPTGDFYRIDTRILVPQVDPEDWSLRVTGLVDRPLELRLDDLLARDWITEHITLQCVSNPVGGSLVGNAVWAGVPLAALLDEAGVRPEATQVVGRSVDGWTGGFPTEVLDDGRPAMVAVTMNGEPLPARHGFPARLVIPGLYGYVSATKWLTEIELTTWEAFDGYWIERGWAKEGPIKTQSRIDVPAHGAAVDAGTVVVAGVAWAPTREVERVELRVDDGPWQPAALSTALSDHAWVQWRVEWAAEPGRHTLAVRATDGDGDVQTAEVAPPEPSGATGHHTIAVEVRS